MAHVATQVVEFAADRTVVDNIFNLNRETTNEASVHVCGQVNGLAVSFGQLSPHAVDLRFTQRSRTCDPGLQDVVRLAMQVFERRANVGSTERRRRAATNWTNEWVSLKSREEKTASIPSRCC